jgi:predicted NAD/FAD-binding protein/DUF1365 family protein
VTTPPTRVAVVGSGVAGLTAAYVASRSAHVTLFEADDRLGGHADTHWVDDGADGLAIDTGFIVHNPRTYPVLLRMFAELDVATQASEMSMSIRDDDSGLEWAGALGRRGLFPTSANLRNPRYLAMLAEVPRFHRRARATSGDIGADRTLREFLHEGRFSAYFVRHFMEPLVAAVWSCDPDVALDYPARYLFTFLEHHGMLGIFGSPQWRTVTGGSQAYVAKVAEVVPDVRTGTKVTSVLETPSGVEVTDGNGLVSTYDAVVVATHPGQALALLSEPTAAQREVLGAMPYVPNTALLHTDASVMPRAGRAWASWNFLRRPGGVTVTYDLTRLQRLDTGSGTHYFVTLGGEDLVDPGTVIDRMEYEHPLYNPTSVAAQARLPEIHTGRVVFAGAYHGWGFHEDGARSGLAAVERLGLSWLSPSIGVRGLETGAGAPSSTTSARSASLGIYETTIRHTRRRPFARRFTHRSQMWVVDVDDLPDHGLLGRFEARDHVGDPERSLRENLEAFLDRHGVDVRGGRMVLAANARAFGYCFNPISVFWCWDRHGDLAATVVEVHNTYGDRHAYLVHTDEQGRGNVDKSMYVSPFHGTDGTYRVAAPVPCANGSDRLDIAVTLDTDDGSTFSASLSGRRSDITPLRAAPAAIRHTLLIRMHGVRLWLRRLPIQPRPTHDQEGFR